MLFDLVLAVSGSKSGGALSTFSEVRQFSDTWRRPVVLFCLGLAVNGSKSGGALSAFSEVRQFSDVWRQPVVLFGLGLAVNGSRPADFLPGLFLNSFRRKWAEASRVAALTSVAGLLFRVFMNIAREMSSVSLLYYPMSINHS